MPTSFNPSDSPLLDDFGRFLRYLERHPNLPLTGAGDLKTADLWALNQQVDYPAPAYVTPRSRQGDYPLLNFFIQVVTASRLAVVQFGKAVTLVTDAARLEAYQGLTDVEKYLFLLETAWCYVDWATLDGDDRSGMGADWFRKGVSQLLQNPVGTSATLFQRGWVLEDNPRTIHVGWPVNAYVRAGYWFGWYAIREVPPPPKRDRYALEIDQVTLTDWGKTCLTLLVRERPFHAWNKHAFRHFASEADEAPAEKRNVNAFNEVFRTLLDEPDLLSLYPINPNPPRGTYWLRIELPAHRVGRTIALPARQTLDDLHGQIQSAFRFDNDHLYGFYMNPRNPYGGEQYYDPRGAEGWVEGYPAAETRLADLNLYEGQQFLYLFDFGDQWEFLITVARHLPDEISTTARVVEQVGEAPKQYGEEDE